MVSNKPPKALYEKLHQFLVEQVFHRGKVDNTLYVKTHQKQFLILQIYVDDIMFCGSDTSLASEFANLMMTRFEMSLLGTLRYFLGLQITQTSSGIFISQQKYASELLKKFKLDNCKAISTPLVLIPNSHWSAPLKLFLQHFTGQSLVVCSFSDADWGGFLPDQKSTSGYCYTLGSNMVS
ncbi:uncharacterized mitochondrial protein AtMg00810-like [Cornus florida]|uniref:uncharacterized mitochondrial protein AtMg00810-like n=1 Tax=Cornus florida TaxID=4283 RepID=UPI002898D092|nr:uncharacterized mitochondrial protein AtMg00810-like [Cornus florida]